MARHHTARNSVVRRLRPSPDRFAAAGALQDPNLPLQLRAAQSHGRRPASPPPSSTALRRRRGALLAAIRGALAGETVGALLLVAAVLRALLWSNSPW